MASTKKGKYSDIKLSVFFPAYNEEANIKDTVEKSYQVLENLELKDYEIIVVDDGSKDKTPIILQELQKRLKKLWVITHSPNKGYGQALISGYYGSKMDWIAFNDSDGQFDFSEITKFLDLIPEYDVIWGYRRDRQDPVMRKINGWGWNFLSGLLLGFHVRDVDCAFRVVNKKVIEKIPHLESTRGGMISPELLAKAKNAGFKITEVGVHHFPRTAGEQTGANLKVILRSFGDLYKLWGKLK
jgi:glycosyltransferase involved in cell wall biosynthesis